MPRQRVTLQFYQGLVGVTETYYSPDLTGNALQVSIRDLISRRNDLLYASVQWRGVRLADATLLRRSKLYPPGTYTPFDGNDPIVVPSDGRRANQPDIGAFGDQARACLQLRFSFNNNRSALRYFGLVPDGITAAEPNPPNFGGPVVNWKTDFDTFVNFLVNGAWSLRARDLPPGIDPQNPTRLSTIRNWYLSAAQPNNIGFGVDATPAPGLSEGTFVQVSGVRRRGTDRLSYNGRYFVDSINLTQVPGRVIAYLRGTESGDIDSIKLPGTVFPIRYAYFPIQRIEPIRVGVHKRGKPQGSPTGRARKRASLDP